LLDLSAHELLVVGQVFVVEITVVAVEVLGVVVLFVCRTLAFLVGQVEIAVHSREAGVKILREQRPHRNRACKNIATTVTALIHNEVLDTVLLQVGKTLVESVGDTVEVSIVGKTITWRELLDIQHTDLFDNQ